MLEQLQFQTQSLEAYEILSFLGFRIDMTKSQFSPNFVITYLGILWDGSRHLICPADKYVLKNSLTIWTDTSITGGREPHLSTTKFGVSGLLWRRAGT